MRNRYFVCYDVHDPQRLVQTHKKMQGYGESVQYSIFMCDLNDKEFIIMKEDLENILNLSEDRLLIINVGQTDKSSKHIITIGMSFKTQNEASIVV